MNENGKTTVELEEVKQVTLDLQEAVIRLKAQLSSSPNSTTLKELEEIVSSPTTTLLVARKCNDTTRIEHTFGTKTKRIVGMLTLVILRLPTGIRAWIEDVVVDQQERGNNVGRLLVKEAISKAAASGAINIDLTSRPSRQAANHLYSSLGFVIRDTNVYRLEIRKDQ
ncbi:MAG: GNAT family N-acetyltransferase [Actinobacteria bacterium]|nr:GNAT family N-acetyltransferase [Actinomycetota bacterium]MCL6104895.1 GNAT family N-acetyltransferase [Actinomycetota bacterium]